MIPAYIIGKQGQYRNPQLLEQLAANFRVVEKNGFVDVSSLDLSRCLDVSAFRISTGREPLATEVACGVAHLRAWKYLVLSGLEELAVFEDDVFPSRGVTNLAQLATQITRLHGSWQLNLESRPGDKLVTHLFRRSLTVRRSLIPPRGAAAYIISRSAAIDALQSLVGNSGQEKLDGPVDHSVCLSKAVVYWIATPPLFEINSKMPSFIENRESSRKHKVITSNPKMTLRRWVKLLRMSLNLESPVRSSLLWARPLKYLLSIHFLTAWFNRRFQKYSRS